MVRADSHRVPLIPCYSGSRRGVPLFAYGAVTRYGVPFQTLLLSGRRPLMSVPRPQSGMPDWFRLFPVRSPLLRESRSISLPLGTEMFQFPRFPPHRLWVQRWVTTHPVAGFSHSGICGSTPVCGSSQLIAAYHALHRLLAPRHPPCALSSLPTLARFSMTPVQLSKWKSLGPLPVSGRLISPTLSAP